MGEQFDFGGPEQGNLNGGGETAPSLMERRGDEGVVLEENRGDGANRNNEAGMPPAEPRGEGGGGDANDEAGGGGGAAAAGGRGTGFARPQAQLGLYVQHTLARVKILSKAPSLAMMDAKERKSLHNYLSRSDVGNRADLQQRCVFIPLYATEAAVDTETRSLVPNGGAAAEIGGGGGAEGDG